MKKLKRKRQRNRVNLFSVIRDKEKCELRPHLSELEAVAITTSDDDDDDDDSDNGNVNIEWAKESEMTNLQNSFYKLEIPRN